MSADKESVSVRILDKEYQISCPKGQEQSLRDCTNYLDAQMRAIQKTGRVIGLDRIAIMAGLNIAREFMKVKHLDPKEVEGLTNRLIILQDKIDQTLMQHHFTETKNNLFAKSVKKDDTKDQEEVETEL